MAGNYQMGSPLGPDSRAVADLAAIDTYVRTTCRARVNTYPESLPLIVDYERWRQGVGYWDMMVWPNDVLSTAKNKRDSIAKSQDSVLRPDAQVEEGAFVTSPPNQASIFPSGLFWGMLAGGLGVWYIQSKLKRK